MGKTRSRTIVFILILVAFALSAVLFAGARNHVDIATSMVEPTVQFPATPTSDALLDIAFREHVSATDLNSGLTMARLGAGIATKGPTPNPSFVSFVVFNNSDEPIVFDDIGFGVRVFSPKVDLSGWQEVVMPVHPAKTSVTLPPRTTTFDLDILNSWTVTKWGRLDGSTARLLVMGKGVITAQTYSAYLDLTLVP